MYTVVKWEENYLFRSTLQQEKITDKKSKVEHKRTDPKTIRTKNKARLNSR